MYGRSFCTGYREGDKIDPGERFQSALEMFRAFENITKKDRRYQRLLAGQLGIRMGLVALTAGFIVLAGYGVHEIRRERTDMYNGLVEEQIELRDAGDYEGQEDAFAEASAMMPGALESYYQNACSLYKQERYEDCIAFIDYDICENEKIDLTRQEWLMYII